MPAPHPFLRSLGPHGGLHGIDSLSLREDEIFIKTRVGRDESRRSDSTIPRRLRTLLTVVDGRRSVGALRAAIHTYRGLDDSLDMLHRMGFIEPLPERWDIG